MRHYIIKNNKTYQKDIGLLVYQIRKAKRFSMSDLARISGVSRHSISMIENGQGDIKVSTLNKICKGLGVSLFSFFEIINNAKVNFMF